MWKDPRTQHRVLAVILLVTLLLSMGIVPVAAQDVAPVAPPQAQQGVGTGVYQNPLEAAIPGDGVVESCADPSIIRGQESGDPYWYVFCTTDPLNDADRDAGGNPVFHLIPILRSYDLVNWEYVGDVFSTRPDWVADDAGLWAPDVHFFNGQYYLYYAASWTDLPGGGSAIGVATAPSLLGPWTESGAPVVEPHAPPCCPNDRRWVFDPSVIEADGQLYIFYGSYFGGISARELSADGLHSDPATQVQITIANRYEGAFVMQHGEYFYLFVSATNCCAGPLTGYSVFVGRSTDVLGPYVDREGVSLLEGRVGGTPVISMNGNRWVGAGHNTVFTDFDGQDWFLYHAIDVNDPYLVLERGINERPMMLDPLDWVDGWPTVRAGEWASDGPVQAPAAQPGQESRYRPKFAREPRPGALLEQPTDEFEGGLEPQWTWVREPAAGTYGVEDGAFWFNTQAADIYVDSNNASVLTQPAPSGNYMVEAKLRLDLPPEGCCYNYVQGGLVIYDDDDNFIKLTHVSIWETRQTEFAKELFPVPEGYPRYGNTVVGPPGEWTWLRIVVTEAPGGQEHYRAYTSRDGINWVRGGVWTHDVGPDAQIGLVSMGGEGFATEFEYMRVYRLRFQETGAP